MRVFVNKRAWRPDMWTDEMPKARTDKDWKHSFNYNVLSLPVCLNTLHKLERYTVEASVASHKTHNAKFMMY